MPGLPRTDRIAVRLLDWTWLQHWLTERTPVTAAHLDRIPPIELPDDLEVGHLTQTWLAVSDDSEATTSGASWYHQRRQRPAADSVNQRFQD